MTKAEWISVIKHTMMKIDEQGIYREPLLERHIQSVYEQMFNEEYMRNPHNFDIYTKTYTESPGTGAALSNGYTMTNKPINLPRSAGGVFGVDVITSTSPSGDQFLPTTYQGYLDNRTAKFDTVGINGIYYFAVRGDVLYSTVSLAGGVPGNETFADVTIRMIPKFTSMSSTEEVMIPGGAEDHFIDRVIDTIKHMTPVDLFNDNTVQ